MEILLLDMQNLSIIMSVFVIALCVGDSGAPLWLKESKVVVAVYKGEGFDDTRKDFPCGYGESIATRTTHPEVLEFIKQIKNDHKT